MAIGSSVLDTWISWIERERVHALWPIHQVTIPVLTVHSHWHRKPLSLLAKQMCSPGGHMLPSWDNQGTHLRLQCVLEHKIIHSEQLFTNYSKWCSTIDARTHRFCLIDTRKAWWTATRTLKCAWFMLGVSKLEVLSCHRKRETIHHLHQPHEASCQIIGAVHENIKQCFLSDCDPFFS